MGLFMRSAVCMANCALRTMVGKIDPCVFLKCPRFFESKRVSELRDLFLDHFCPLILPLNTKQKDHKTNVKIQWLGKSMTEKENCKTQ